MLKFFDCSSNENEEDTIAESVDLFKKAKRSIKIIAGDPSAPFYNDQRVVDSISQAVSADDVDVKIAYYPENEKFKKRNLKTGLWTIRGLNVQELKVKPLRHFTVVDGKHVRLEADHPFGASHTPAIICKNMSVLGHEMEADFNTLVGIK